MSKRKFNHHLSEKRSVWKMTSVTALTTFKIRLWSETIGKCDCNKPWNISKKTAPNLGNSLLNRSPTWNVPNGFFAKSKTYLHFNNGLAYGKSIPTMSSNFAPIHMSPSLSNKLYQTEIFYFIKSVRFLKHLNFI